MKDGNEQRSSTNFLWSVAYGVNQRSEDSERECWLLATKEDCLVPLAVQVRCIKKREWLTTLEIKEIQRTIDKEDENRAKQMEVEETELNETVQHQETEIRQGEATGAQGLDEINEEL